MGDGVSRALWLQTHVTHNIITRSRTEMRLRMARNTSALRVCLVLSGMLIQFQSEQQHREHVSGPDLSLRPRLSRDACHHVSCRSEVVMQQHRRARCRR